MALVHTGTIPTPAFRMMIVVTWAGYVPTSRMPSTDNFVCFRHAVTSVVI